MYCLFGRGFESLQLHKTPIKDFLGSPFFIIQELEK